MICALRELREETAIKENHIDIVPHFRYTVTYHPKYQRKSHRGKNIEKTVVLFLAHLKSGEGSFQDEHFHLTEHIGFEWHSFDPENKIQDNVDCALQALRDFLAGSKL